MKIYKWTFEACVHQTRGPIDQPRSQDKLERIDWITVSVLAKSLGEARENAKLVLDEHDEFNLLKVEEVINK